MRFVSMLLPCALTVGAVASVGADFSDAALRQLQDSTIAQRNGQHLLNLKALRNLKDPDLLPLFSHFSQDDEWPVQVHAVLGLAELSEEQTIDPWLVQQISPTAREHLIAQALDDGLLQQEQMETLIEWDLLEATPRLLLLADLRLLGVEIDQEMLKKLANTTDLSVAMFAALLSKDEIIIETATRELRRATRIDRDHSLSQTLRLIRQYQLTAAAPWLLSLLKDDAVALTNNERYWVLYALLRVNQEAGLEVWNQAFSIHPERRDQARYLLLLLEAGFVPSQEVIQRLNIDMDDQLMGLMVRAGNVNKTKADITPDDIQSLIDLVERSHRDSIKWAFRVANQLLSPADAQFFYEQISIIPQHTTKRRNEIAIKAFVRLIELAPGKAWEILRKTKDDSVQQELLLYSMLQVADQDAIQEALKLRRIGVNRADVMTLLIIARGTEPLDEADQRNLGIIAAGGGLVGTALETQAAWLYLKRMGLADKAVAAVSKQ